MPAPKRPAPAPTAVRRQQALHATRFRVPVRSVLRRPHAVRVARQSGPQRVAPRYCCRKPRRHIPCHSHSAHTTTRYRLQQSHVTDRRQQRLFGRGFVPWRQCTGDVNQGRTIDVAICSTVMAGTSPTAVMRCLPAMALYELEPPTRDGPSVVADPSGAMNTDTLARPSL